jgi:hypothetical protein
MIIHLNNAYPQWTSIGDALGIGMVRSICIDSDGILYAAGDFKNNAGFNYVAKWDGISWTELGGTNALKANNSIYSIVIDQSNNIYAGGNFTDSTGNIYIAKWNGNNWSSLTTINDNFISNLLITPTNQLYVGTGYSGTITKWNGSALVNLQSFQNSISPFIDDGNVKITGDAFGNIVVGTNSNIISVWDGNNWTHENITPNLVGFVRAIHADNQGNIYAAGNINSPSTTKIFKRELNQWSEIIPVNGSTIQAINSDISGNIYATGQCYLEGSYPSVLKWNGNNWIELGGINSLPSLGIGTDLKIFGQNIYVSGINMSGYAAIYRYSPGSAGISHVASNSLLFPNPANEFITIDNPNSSATTEITISNLLGESIFANTYSGLNTIKINTNNFPHGWYTLKLHSDQSFSTQKICIMH